MHAAAAVPLSALLIFAALSAVALTPNAFSLANQPSKLLMVVQRPSA